LRRLLLVAVVGVCAPAAATEYFMAPGGNDMAMGTRAAPWATFVRSLPRLLPGDTLTLLSGHYTQGTTGMLVADCSMNVSSGLAFAPITVRADVERQAWLDSSPGGSAVRLSNCASWIIDGLHVSGADNASATGENVLVTFSDHITLRRLLVERTNRYQNEALILSDATTNLLVEECELYRFHRDGLILWNGQASVVRRCYFNSLGDVDLPGGWNSIDPMRGDDAIEETGFSRGNIIENCVSEGQLVAFANSPFAGDENRANRIFGSVSMDTSVALLTDAADNTSTSMPTAITARDLVADGVSGPAVYFRASKWSRCTQCSALRVSSAYWGEVDVAAPGDGFYSTLIDRSLATGAATSGSGYSFNTQAIGRAEDVLAFGFSDPLNGPAASFVRASEADPQLGACKLWAPDNSLARQLGLGAEVLYRYENGALTTTPLWLPDGGFPCGATVAGSNDDAGCSSVNLRLNVNANGCPFPASYPAGPQPRDAGVVIGRTVYISPSGSDSAPGTQAQPWATFGFALPQLLPGDTLMLLDGTYTLATSGLPSAQCDMTTQTGSPNAPITVQALHPRGAVLQSIGGQESIGVYRCSDWVFRDLVTLGGDLFNGGYDVIALHESTRITLKGLLVMNDNRFQNGELVGFSDTNDSTFEDSELYNFHRHALAFFHAHGNTARNLYMNGRDWPDIDGGYPSAGPGGDEGVLFYDSASANVIDGCMVENAAQGFSLIGIDAVSANRLSHIVVLGGASAFSLDDLAGDPKKTTAGNTAVDLLAVGSQLGMSSVSGRFDSCDHCTFVATTAPFSATTQGGMAAPSESITDSLFDVGDAGNPITLTGVTGFALGFVDVHGYGAVPPGVNVFDEALLNPCVLAPVPGRGSDGGALGADVRALFFPTTTSLCGAVVPGLNDDAGGSCIGAWDRLTGGLCPVPDAGPPDSGVDGGSTSDAGAADGGAGDGGVQDAGLSDAGLPDAGPQTLRTLSLGCGCDGSGGSALLLLALLTLRRGQSPLFVRRG
jgi:hypothetical protein